MKDVRPALRAILLADADVYAAIDGDVSRAQGGSRIFTGTLPQGETFPSVVQNLISEDSDYHMQGGSGLMQARIQIDCWALTQDAAVSLANLVYDGVSGYRGVITFGTPQQQIDVQAIFHDLGRDDYDPVAKLHARRRDYLIWFAGR